MFIEDLLEALHSDADTLRDYLTQNRDVLPEVWALQELSEDDNGSHKNNFLHSIQVVQQCKPASNEVLLAALLHDVGKAQTRERVGGKVTFHNHEMVGARLIRKRLLLLGFPPAFAENVINIILLSSRMQAAREGRSDSGIRRLSKDAGSLWDSAATLARADCTSKHQRVHDRVNTNMDKLERDRARIAKADKDAAFRPVLNGHDLMEMGYQGRALGEALTWLTEANRSGELLDPDEAREALRKDFK